MTRRLECSRQRCHRPVKAAGLCQTHLVQAADASFSRFIRDRDGYCQAAVYVAGVPCLGDLQCMHLISRSYRALRWDPQNAAAGCAAHHAYLTQHPLEHYVFCERYLGREAWEALRDRRFGPPMRPEDYLDEVLLGTGQSL